MNFTEYNNFFFKFIQDNIQQNPNKLRLKWHNSTLPFDIPFAITQIECRQRANKKLPSILSNQSFLFPSSLLAEQCTDEIIAKFHGTLFSGATKIVDLTAGLCIDSYFISHNVESVIAIEINEHTANVDRYNMSQLNANVTVVNNDAESFINNTTDDYDAIFIDPARRNSNNSKVFKLDECSPNILNILPKIKRSCNYIIIKASPLLDITELIRTVDNISDIWILSIKNECKELLFKIDLKNNIDSPIIHTINFTSSTDKQSFSFKFNDNIPDIKYNSPSIGKILLEPNSSIMKSGGYKYLPVIYSEIKGIATDTHLYLSDSDIEDFPGRKFIITATYSLNDKALKMLHKTYPQINVSTRNFRLTPEEIKKRLKVKDGGEKYLFGISLSDKSQLILICDKVIS